MRQNKVLTILGWILTVVIVAMLGFSASMKFAQPDEFWKAWVDQFGYPKELAFPIGITEVVCAVLFLIPQTRVLGAVLLTGYLGGATATHVRVKDVMYGPVIGGGLVWLALFLRDPRIRALLPITSSAPASPEK